MTNYEMKQQEIQTIKDRGLKLRLSDADCGRIIDKAMSAGLTVEELLQSFIGDLVDGTYSNGSDERSCANDWFERCGFAHYPEKTYGTYIACGHSAYSSASELISEYDELQEELNDSELNTVEIDFLHDELDSVLEDYNRFVKWAGVSFDGKPIAKSLEEELDNIRKMLNAFY